MINQAKTDSTGKSEEELMSIETQYWVDMKDALERLKGNEDFKKVILDGYFKDKAVNGVSMLAHDYVVQNGHRPQIMEALVAISQLEDYFATIDSMGTQTPDEELDDNEASEE